MVAVAVAVAVAVVVVVGVVVAAVVVVVVVVHGRLEQFGPLIDHICFDHMASNHLAI